MFKFTTLSLHHHHHHHHHHHKHPWLGHLARSVSRVKVVLSIVSLVSQLFSFPVGCKGMILKGFGFVALFASVKARSFCIHLSCLVCSLSVVRGEWSLLFCSHVGFIIMMLYGDARSSECQINYCNFTLHFTGCRWQ
jgi:hypothetical protein